MRTRIHRQRKTTDEAQPSNYNLYPQPFPVQKSSSKKTNNHFQTSNSSSHQLSREIDNKSNLPHFSISAPPGAYDYLQKYSQLKSSLNSENKQKESFKDKNNKQASDSKNGLELALTDNSGRGLLEVNETKFYSVVTPKLEVSREKAVISAKAAGARRGNPGHTIIYIEYFASNDDTEPTIVTTDLFAEKSIGFWW